MSVTFGKIVLSSDNILVPKHILDKTPSRIHGLNKQDENDLRILGCESIQTSGILLKLPQIAMTTGQILFQRFYYSKSFIRYDMETTAMCCIFLASKIEESPRMIRDVLNVFHHMKQIRGQSIIAPMELSQYTALKTRVLNAECLLLKVLGFCVHVKQPHKLILMYLQLLGLEKNKNLMQCAWNNMNDSLRTDVFVRYKPEVIACACVYLAGRKVNLPLPNNPPWYGVFNVEENDMVDVSYRIMELYNRPKLNFAQLELNVEELKKMYNETRTKQWIEKNIPSSISTSTDTQPLATTLHRIDSVISGAVPIIIETNTGTTTKRSRSLSRSPTSKKTRRSPSRSPSKNNKRKSRYLKSKTSSNDDDETSINHARLRSLSRSRTLSKCNKRTSKNEVRFHSSRSLTSPKKTISRICVKTPSSSTSSTSSSISSYSNKRVSRNHARSPSSSTSRTSYNYKRTSRNEARLHSSSRYQASFNNNKIISRIHVKSPSSSNSSASSNGDKETLGCTMSSFPPYKHTPKHCDRRTKRIDSSPDRKTHRSNERYRREYRCRSKELHRNNINKERSKCYKNGSNKKEIK